MRSMIRLGCHKHHKWSRGRERIGGFVRIILELRDLVFSLILSRRDMSIKEQALELRDLEEWSFR